jgi:hypothetical protein
VQLPVATRGAAISHLDAPHYISFAVVHAKYNKGRLK